MLCNTPEKIFESLAWDFFYLKEKHGMNLAAKFFTKQVKGMIRLNILSKKEGKNAFIAIIKTIGAKRDKVVGVPEALLS